MNLLIKEGMHLQELLFMIHGSRNEKDEDIERIQQEEHENSICSQVPIL
jgi:hypothetical protein